MYPPVDDRIRLADDHREAMLGVLTLPKNADKGGWHDMPVDELLQLLDGEIEEFYAALWGFRHHGEPLDRVIAEAGDCSAFIAMIVDNCKKGLANA
jgi:hypothetical protein